MRKLLFKGIVYLRIIFLQPVRCKMTLCANPHPFAKIIVIPMMINESYLFFTQFASVVRRIKAFIFDATNGMPILPKSCSSHIIPMMYSNLLPISFIVVIVHLSCAILAITAIARWFVVSLMKLSDRQELLAFITSLHSIYNYSLPSFVITDFRTMGSFISKGWRDLEWFPAY